MKLFQDYITLLVVLTSLSGLELLQGRAVEQRDTSLSENDSSDMRRVNCATKMREEMCSSINPAQNYSLVLSSPVYSPRQEIKGNTVKSGIIMLLIL